MGRTNRLERTGSARFDRSCRNHGSCPWCQRRRTIGTLRMRAKATDEMQRDSMELTIADWWNETSAHCPELNP